MCQYVWSIQRTCNANGLLWPAANFGLGYFVQDAAGRVAPRIPKWMMHWSSLGDDHWPWMIQCINFIRTSSELHPLAFWSIRTCSDRVLMSSSDWFVYMFLLESTLLRVLCVNRLAILHQVESTLPLPATYSQRTCDETWRKCSNIIDQNCYVMVPVCGACTLQKGTCKVLPVWGLDTVWAASTVSLKFAKALST